MRRRRGQTLKKIGTGDWVFIQYSTRDYNHPSVRTFNVPECGLLYTIVYLHPAAKVE